MRKTLPIKDKLTIQNIKNLYLKKDKKRDLLLFLLSINTGINLLELLRLNVGDVKDKSYLLFKNKYSFPLNDEIKEIIKEVIKNRKINEPLFVNNRAQRLDRTGAFNNFKEICLELALGEEISIISLRKTFGYFYYLKYKDLSFLQWLFNQNSIEQTFSFIDVKENMNLRFKDGVAL